MSTIGVIDFNKNILGLLIIGEENGSHTPPTMSTIQPQLQDLSSIHKNILTTL